MENKPCGMDTRLTYSDNLDGLSKDAQISKLKKENEQWRLLLGHVLFSMKSGLTTESILGIFEQRRSNVNSQFK